MIPSDERTIEIDKFRIEVAALGADEGVALSTRIMRHVGRTVMASAKNGSAADALSSLAAILGGLFAELDETEVKIYMDRLLKGAMVTFEENGATVTRELAKAKASAPFAGKGYVLLRAAIFSAEVNLRDFYNGGHDVVSALLARLGIKMEALASVGLNTSPTSGKPAAS